MPEQKPVSGADDVAPLTRSEFDTFARRVLRTFRGDQCAYDAVADLRGLADLYLPQSER